MTDTLPCKNPALPGEMGGFIIWFTLLSLKLSVLLWPCVRKINILPLFENCLVFLCPKCCLAVFVLFGRCFYTPFLTFISNDWNYITLSHLMWRWGCLIRVVVAVIHKKWKEFMVNSIVHLDCLICLKATFSFSSYWIIYN